MDSYWIWEPGGPRWAQEIAFSTNSQVMMVVLGTYLETHCFSLIKMRYSKHSFIKNDKLGSSDPDCSVYIFKLLDIPTLRKTTALWKVTMVKVFINFNWNSFCSTAWCLITLTHNSPKSHERQWSAVSCCPYTGGQAATRALTRNLTGSQVHA